MEFLLAYNRLKHGFIAYLRRRSFVFLRLLRVIDRKANRNRANEVITSILLCLRCRTLPGVRERLPEIQGFHKKIQGERRVETFQ